MVRVLGILHALCACNIFNKRLQFERQYSGLQSGWYRGHHNAIQFMQEVSSQTCMVVSAKQVQGRPFLMRMGHDLSLPAGKSKLR